MSSSRKPLIRSSSHSDRPTTMRNWPLFVFLLCLVLFFYAFYVYQAQGAILSQTNEEVRQLSAQLSLTKGKLVGSMADLETSNSEKKTISTQLEDITKKNEECMNSLRNTKLRIDTLEKDGKTNTDNYTKMQEELAALKEKSEELQRNNTALNSLVSTQSQLITQLNQTIGIIKFEKEELKNAANLNNLTPKTEKPDTISQNLEQSKNENGNEKEVSVATQASTVSQKDEKTPELESEKEKKMMNYRQFHHLLRILQLENWMKIIQKMSKRSQNQWLQNQKPLIEKRKRHK
uniref:Si:ch211-1a19.3 n=1 Tax=Caenorhabditis tropicalis TaxID=1561998 RepID=A0A1I7T8H4_9PELO